MTQRALRLLIIAAAAIVLSGCEQEGPAERAGERLDDVMDEARERFEDARDEVEDAVEDVREALEEE